MYQIEVGQVLTPVVHQPPAIMFFHKLQLLFAPVLCKLWLR